MKFTKISLFILCFYIFTTPVVAAKPRIQKPTYSKTAGIAYSSVRLSRNTNSVIVTFLNLNRVKRITYTLSYVSGGTSQGVVGTLTPSGQATDSRDLYFGTCSHGVCTAHYNLQNVSFLVQTTLTSGATHTKRYRIKI